MYLQQNSKNKLASAALNSFRVLALWTFLVSISQSLYARKPTTSLKVLSNVPSATILVDGIIIGQANSILDVDPGAIVIEVTFPGYKTTKKRVQIDANKVNITKVDLVKAPVAKPKAKPKPKAKIAKSVPRPLPGKTSHNSVPKLRVSKPKIKPNAKSPRKVALTKNSSPSKQKTRPPKKRKSKKKSRLDPFAETRSKVAVPPPTPTKRPTPRVINRSQRAPAGTYVVQPQPAPNPNVQYIQPSTGQPVIVQQPQGQPYYIVPTQPPPQVHVAPAPLVSPRSVSPRSVEPRATQSPPPPPSAFSPSQKRNSYGQAKSKKSPRRKTKDKNLLWTLGPFGSGQFQNDQILAGTVLAAAQIGALIAWQTYDAQANDLISETNAVLAERQEIAQSVSSDQIDAYNAETQAFRTGRQTDASALQANAQNAIIAFGGLWIGGAIFAIMFDGEPEQPKRRRFKRRSKRFSLNLDENARPVVNTRLVTLGRHPGDGIDFKFLRDERNTAEIKTDNFDLHDWSYMLTLKKSL